MLHQFRSAAARFAGSKADIDTDPSRFGPVKIYAQIYLQAPAE
jgi:hypothetical protein